jgi:predicted transcriptional regulator
LKKLIFARYPKRARILSIRSVETSYQLAKLLGRATPNVQKDVHDLAEYGIIELKKIKKKGLKRTSLQPEYNWDGFDIAV